MENVFVPGISVAVKAVVAVIAAPTVAETVCDDGESDGAAFTAATGAKLRTSASVKNAEASRLVILEGVMVISFSMSGESNLPRHTIRVTSMTTVCRAHRVANVANTQRFHMVTNL